MQGWEARYGECTAERPGAAPDRMRRRSRMRHDSVGYARGCTVVRTSHRPDHRTDRRIRHAHPRTGLHVHCPVARRRPRRSTIARRVAARGGGHRAPVRGRRQRSRRRTTPQGGGETWRRARQYRLSGSYGARHSGDLHTRRQCQRGRRARHRPAVGARTQHLRRGHHAARWTRV